MKIAISSKGKQLTSEIDERFGRAKYFIIVNPQSLEFNVLKIDSDSQQGAGIKTAKAIIDSGADFIITGNCGPKAFRVLKEANIKISLNAAGRVIDVIQKYKNGFFSKALKPNTPGGQNKQECANV